MSHWNDVLSADEIDALHDMTEQLDRNFATDERAYYATATHQQLRNQMVRAWYSNDGSSYQMARSHLALRGASSEWSAAA